MADILKGLNPQQKQAVTHDKGPLLIIAGAGTGKTSVITRRIAYLLDREKTRQDEILALTFTDKAANEMEERVDLLVPYGYTDIWISTFHSFGDRILRDNALTLGLSPDFKVLTRPEAAIFFREHLFEFDISYFRPLGNPTKFIEAILTYFSRLKDEDISVDEYTAYTARLREKAGESNDGILREEALKHTELSSCFKKYQELLIQEGKIDFGNQFYMALELLRKRPSVLGRYRDKFKYILIDEFQDTNFAQFKMLELLAGEAKNITVVADDDQCIYRFRGAAYSNIINFIKTYPESEKITLIKNYRSTQKILDSAYQLIQHNNPDRFEVQSDINKRLIGLAKKGKAVEHFNFDTLSSEADYVARLIKEKSEKKKYKYSDFAILVRSNSDADPFLRSLNMLGVPWRFSGSQGLYSRKEIRLCISFLKLTANIEDSLSLYYLLSSEIYSVDMADLSLLMHYAKRKNISLFAALRYDLGNEQFNGLSNQTKETINKFMQDIERYLEHSKNMPTGRLLYLFLTQTGFISSLTKNPSLENEEKISNIAKFFDIVSNYEILTREDRVVNFVEHLSLLMEVGDDPAMAEPDLDVPAVAVLTVHKAKGLEFNVVFMVGLVQGRFPWPKRAQTIELPDELIKDILPSGDFHAQEERRLFYVGMTRARKELFLTSSQDYGGKKTRKISRFIFEALGTEEKAKIEVKKASSLEAIKRNAPLARIKPLPLAKAVRKEAILNLSYYQIDDYMSCPLKYKYVHILRVPIMEHHTVLYGKAMHDAVLRYYQSRSNNIAITESDLLNIFDNAFRPEGFFSRKHIEERRNSAYLALRRFFSQESKKTILPTYMEKEFSFFVDNNKVNGRWDRVDILETGEAVIIDFKTSEVKKQKDADKKAKESLQLSIYALAYKSINGVLPQAVELYFLESALIGRAKKTDEDLEKTIDIIKEAAGGIRGVDFTAKPKYLTCSYCAYNQICPSAIIRVSR
ncbi:MAG: hypothetical protein COV72_06095 [Candidatus Omnitrophica bacterium CG11_big_fil_rev_8_21_14_0_20_42_13]|uniref:DNA 3'-5' helicase n=1 Tax=Candidatus Ghiorseimicrobium undicola TaxID=1974746 RepID=A0A2H0LYV5_9BACT|nr:MAG: hypothetical protein COV72_06095 [Candidatus Omnitrophica bacterium CG11_big_fil_rev_8_21_14_0_20_42_13]